MDGKGGHAAPERAQLQNRAFCWVVLGWVGLFWVGLFSLGWVELFLPHGSFCVLAQRSSVQAVQRDVTSVSL